MSKEEYAEFNSDELAEWTKHYALYPDKKARMTRLAQLNPQGDTYRVQAAAITLIDDIAEIGTEIKRLTSLCIAKGWSFVISTLNDKTKIFCTAANIDSAKTQAEIDSGFLLILSELTAHWKRLEVAKDDPPDQTNS